MTSPAGKIIEGMATLRLEERMAAALRDVRCIHLIGDRAKAYVDAGIELHTIPKDEASAADEIALSIALGERLSS